MLLPAAAARAQNRDHRPLAPQPASHDPARRWGDAPTLPEQGSDLAKALSGTRQQTGAAADECRLPT